MFKISPLALGGFAFLLIVTPVCGQITVQLEHQNGTHRLLRDGKPYAIKGVGGQTQLDRLAAAGGNSIRTWSTDKLDSILDEAQRHHLTVCVGLWLGHERHGFNYQDEASVQRQLNDSLAAVRKFKDHPAVLMWGIGNEMEGNGQNPAIWYAIDHIAREIKKIDPHHPTMTVIAELGDKASKIKSIEQYCPNIEIIGVNSYGGIGSLAERYRAAGGSKPYIVTEHGPNGPWEVAKTDWGSPLEASSTAKGQAYADGYRRAVTSQPGLCLGSYAFLWGHKQETTATWFGMLLADGSRLGAVDAMTEAWTGKPVGNRCPRIESMSADRDVKKLKPGDMVQVTLVAADPEQDTLTVKWVLRQDSGTIGEGGDAQAEEQALTEAVTSTGMSARLKAPDGGGAYRLFAYVYDDKGGAAVVNLPVFVDAPVKAIPAAKGILPFVVYGDEMKSSPYVPAGFMGNTNAIVMKLDSEEMPHSGKTCLKIEYNASDKWGGVLWQSPEKDWEGSRPGGLNLTGAAALEFWARGAEGGETINFLFGVLDGKQLYRDTAKGELKDIHLTTQWVKHRISLRGLDLSRIKTGFGWSLAGQGKPVTIYLDDVRYVAE